MVSNTEELTENSPITVGMSYITKNMSSRKPLGKISELLDVKQKTAVRRLCDPKSKCKSIRKGTLLWYKNKKWKDY